MNFKKCLSHVDTSATPGKNIKHARRRHYCSALFQAFEPRLMLSQGGLAADGSIAPISGSATANLGFFISPPTDVTAVAPNSTVHLTWTASPGYNDNYEVQQTTDLNVAYQSVANTSLTAVDISEPAGTLIYFQVRANANGQVGSNFAAANPVVTPLGNITATATGPNHSLIHLTWQSSTHTTQVEVDRATNSPSNFGFAFFAPPAPQAADDNATTPGSTYYYHLTLSAQDQSGTYFAAPVTVGPVTTAPPVPTNVQGAVLTVSGLPQITWDITSSATPYRIERSLSPNSGFAPVGTAPAGTSGTQGTYNEMFADPGTTYYYRVFATSPLDSDPSAVVSVTTPLAIPSPLLPTVTPDLTAHLSWLTPYGPNVTYNLQILNGPDPSTGTVSNVFTGAGQTTYDIPNLPSSATLYFRLRALLGGSKASAFSTAIPFTTPPAIPVITADKVFPNPYVHDISWTGSLTNPAQFYDFQLSTTAPDSGYNSLSQIPAPAQDFMTSNLPPSSTVYVRVRAFDGNQFSNFSAPFTITTAPFSPFNVTATLNGTHTNIHIGWLGGNQGATGYTVYRNSGPNTPFTKIDIIHDGNTLEDFDPNFPPFTLLTYEVYAVYQSTSAPAFSSPALSNTVMTPPLVPTATASLVSQNNVHLSWVPTPGFTGNYLILRSPPNPVGTDAVLGGSFQATPFQTSPLDVIATLDGSASTYDDIGLPYNTNVSYVVRASDPGDNFIVDSARVNLTTAIAPAAPTQLTAALVGPSTVHLTWQGFPTDGTRYSYILERKGSNDADFEEIAGGTYNPTNTDDKNLAPGTYQYRVRTQDFTIFSSYSNIATVTVPPPLTAANFPPTNLAAASFGPTTVRLTWDGTLSSGSYVIERSLQPDTGFTNLHTVPFSQKTFDDTALPPGTPYYYRVHSTDGTNDSAPSNTVSITTPVAGELFIRQIYLDVLGRAIDSGGLSYWLSFYNAGHTYSDIATAITSSREYDGIVVDAFYFQYLGRHSETAGLNFWVDQMQAGLNAEVIRAGILGSDEYYNRVGGTDTAYITILYTNFLNRSPDTDGLNVWIGQLDHSSPDAQTRSRVLVSTAISNSTESRTAIVTHFYETYLHRNPDPAGLNVWITNLANGITQPQIISFFVTAQEYLNYNHIA